MPFVHCNFNISWLVRQSPITTFDAHMCTNDQYSRFYHHFYVSGMPFILCPDLDLSVSFSIYCIRYVLPHQIMCFISRLVSFTSRVMLSFINASCACRWEAPLMGFIQHRLSSPNVDSPAWMFRTSHHDMIPSCRMRSIISLQLTR